VPTLFDAGPLSGALEWGQRFYTALARLDGKVPDSVRTDWLCDHVWPMAKSALRGEWIEKIDPFIDERIAAERSGDTDRIRAARVAADAAAANAYAAAHVAAAAATNAYAYAVAAADAAADAASCAAADAAAAAATDAYAVAAAYVAADADAHAATNAYVAADAVANANADAAAVAYAATNAYADAAAVAAAHAAAKLKLRNALVECMERAT